MNIIQALKKLRDDIKAWVTNNLNALNTKIENNTVQIDDKLDATSTNPVQNKVVAEKIDEIANSTNPELENKVEEIEGKLNKGFNFTEKGVGGIIFDTYDEWNQGKISGMGYSADEAITENLLLYGPNVRIKALPVDEEFGVIALDGQYVEIGNGGGYGEPLVFNSTAIENYFTGKVSFYGEVESESITNQINAATNSLKEELGLNEAIEATTVTIEELVTTYIDFNFDNGDEEAY